MQKKEPLAEIQRRLKYPRNLWSGCQVQTVKGVPRKQSNLETLNPFLVDEDDTDYRNQLEKQEGSKSDTQGSDASTQTGRTVKKNGCKVM